MATCIPRVDGSSMNHRGRGVTAWYQDGNARFIGQWHGLRLFVLYVNVDFLWHFVSVDFG